MHINTDLYDKSNLTAGLYIVATPIGNLKDITFRALETLKKADIIYCEDTRQSAKLLSNYSISTQTASYHEHNAEKVRPLMLEKLRNGGVVALISDAGTPLISDPGYKLVSLCHEEGIQVISIPGPSAPISALVSSGLPSDHFYFGGFLPPKQGERRHALDHMSRFPHTLIYFETPKRLLATLTDINVTMGNRIICVARELTKTFENVRRGTVEELVQYYSSEGVLKGEIVLLIKGAKAREEVLDGKTEELLKVLTEHMPLKKASTLLSDYTGLPKKILYQKALELRNGQDE